MDGKILTTDAEKLAAMAEAAKAGGEWWKKFWWIRPCGDANDCETMQELFNAVINRRHISTGPTRRTVTINGREYPVPLLADETDASLYAEETYCYKTKEESEMAAAIHNAIYGA